MGSRGAPNVLKIRETFSLAGIRSPDRPDLSLDTTDNVTSTPGLSELCRNEYGLLRPVDPKSVFNLNFIYRPLTLGAGIFF
jgi:hypothetical protein